MPNSYTPAQIEQFKRKAKQLSRNLTITHTEALNCIASTVGHDNWSLLMKHNSVATHESVALVGPTSWPFVRTTVEMRQALRKVSRRGYGRLSRVDEARRLTEDIYDKFVSARNAVEFAIAYMTCLLTVPRFSVDAESKVYEEMRCWLPYAAVKMEGDRSILVNRYYKPVGRLTDEWVKYIEFERMHLRLSNEQLQAFALQSHGDGYLYDDGCPPWWSRKDASAYLERLHKLHA